jgi:hypothetical protein
MRIPPDMQRQDWDLVARGELEDSGGLSRRRLLAGAVSGLALITNGMLLPAPYDEAEAREGAHGGTLGGRRGRNRRGRHKRHNRNKHRNKGNNRRKNDDGPRGAGSGGNRNVAIHVHNYRTVPMQLQGWQFDHYVGSSTEAQRKYAVPDGWGWQALPARAADGSHSSRSFVCNRDRDVVEPRIVAVQIGTDHFVWCFNNPFWWPEAAIYAGSWGSDGRVEGGKLLGSVSMFVNESFSRDGIKVTRLEDTEDHIVFTVDL